MRSDDQTPIISILSRLPMGWLSWITGSLCELAPPSPLAEPLVRFGSRLLKVDTSEMAEPLSYYPSISALFTRSLKTGCRPIGDGFVSPIDGTLRSVDRIISGNAIQTKGSLYSVAALLGDHPSASSFDDGLAWTFYLAPHNYHHVHSPCVGEVSEVLHLPGKLWPVNDWAITRVRDLFPQNERVVVWLETAYGLVACVLVGALNVGRISLSFDSELTLDRKHRVSAGSKHYSPSRHVESGSPLGTFHLGSTVIVLTQSGRIEPSDEIAHSLPRTVRYGESLTGDPRS